MLDLYLFINRQQKSSNTWTFINKLGAATGKIEVMVPERNIEEGREFTFGESIILKAQLAEYKTSAYFEKSSESLFGYISVLPGAFSTFRWE